MNKELLINLDIIKVKKVVHQLLDNYLSIVEQLKTFNQEQVKNIDTFLVSKHSFEGMCDYLHYNFWLNDMHNTDFYEDLVWEIFKGKDREGNLKRTGSWDYYITPKKIFKDNSLTLEEKLEKIINSFNKRIEFIEMYIENNYKPNNN